MNDGTKILRVFPRMTNATPMDPLVCIGDPKLFRPEADEVHVSVTFGYDLVEAKRIANGWKDLGYSVKIGGPALDDPGGDFVPGRYVKKGYVFTSRGCPNRCWFCDVWRRQGGIREIAITEGYNVLDSNLLACSEQHIINVFDMLSQQPRKAEFTGGLDPARLSLEIAHELKRLNPRYIYTAYDLPEDYNPLVQARNNLVKAGFTVSPRSHKLMCYVLIGYPKDTIPAALGRLEQVMELGLTPMAMLYRKGNERPSVAWRRFQRVWARPVIIHSRREA